MGVSFSCPLAISCDLENGFESVVVKSIGLGDVDEQTSQRQSISFYDKDSEAEISQSSDSEKLILDRFFSFKSRKAQSMRGAEVLAEIKQEMVSPLSRSDSREMVNSLPGLDSVISIFQSTPNFYANSPKHEAAIKLQKVYKSFRTRRKLADCAVLVEQSWWKLLDFAELKHSSISFFDLDKHETAISRWSRARTRAAKVGKGLSKNGKARKLALQHWLEAIDPRHRYGHNLHFYYNKWLNSQSKEPFFYWLDIGEGREVNLIEKCPRSKLQQQCIKYLGPMERKAYEVAVEEGKLFFKQKGELLDTTNGSKWIFVLSTSRTLYIGKKKKGSFQHSSFLAGGATLAAGRLVAEKGVLKAVWPHSGHYRPTPENFQDFISFLRENNVDLTDVKLDSADDEEEDSKEEAIDLRHISSGDELNEKDHLETEENDFQNLISDEIISTEKQIAHGFGRKLTTLEIPSKDGLLQKLMNENQIDSPMDGYENVKDSFAPKDDEAKEEEIIPEESVLKRINSHKETKSYQLGEQLSCKWSTGAGPRIGCLRDYPSGLQNHALEQVNLSPRSERRLRLEYSSRASTPSSILSLSSSRRVEWSSQASAPMGSNLCRAVSSRHSIT